MRRSRTKIGEIGGSFWETEGGGKGIHIIENCSPAPVFSLSGRTSLYQITEDICSKFGLKTALLPSYCCDTVIEPFLRSGAEVRFYPVKATESGIKASLDISNGADAVLTMGWFGFGVEERNSLEGEIRDRFKDSVIIRDVTHTLFTEREVGGECDYAFASLRKWTGLFGCGAILRSPEAMASHRDENVRYGEKTEKAVRMKKSFMAGGSSDKAEMLRLFSEAEDILDEDYGGYGPLKRDLTALKDLDERYISSRRRRNYSILYDNRSILEAKGIIPLTGPLNEEEVPLFLPVLLKDAEERRRLRLYLIENRVFCPVHWHISHVHALGNEERKIYDRELSIVCDQRYDAEDMERILYLVEKY